MCVVTRVADSVSPSITEQRGWDEKTDEKNEGGLAGRRKREGKEREGCQHQGGPLALNGYLVKRVEREEAQIKDVPSFKEEVLSSLNLKWLFKGEEETEARRERCLYLRGWRSFRHPAAWQTGGVQGCHRFSWLLQPHNTTCRLCERAPHDAYMRRYRNVIHLKTRAHDRAAHITNCLCKYPFYVSRAFRNCIG